jgi:hypothetical protein
LHVLRILLYEICTHRRIVLQWVPSLWNQRKWKSWSPCQRRYLDAAACWCKKISAEERLYGPLKELKTTLHYIHDSNLQIKTKRDSKRERAQSVLIEYYYH